MSQTILPHRLPYALDDQPGVKMLSLDCFDTLLWRDTHAPGDIFSLLEGVTPDQRRRAELAARKARILARSYGEVTLREIYAELLPAADEATREAHVARELAAEMRHCYAFVPTVALMREARRRGLRVIVVSDTYFERDQLAALIRAAAGDEIADLIDLIFCSCDHRSAKSELLFETVLAHTRVRPDRILHIGDNPRADAIAAARHGLRALHLVQFAASTVQRLRQEAATGALVAVGGTAFQPHRAALAAGEPTIADPAEALGFAVLGPILMPFARWVRQEAEALAATRGGRVHLLFVMRDGHLPREVFSAAFPGLPSHAVEISRFTATAAAMADPAAVRRFILEEVGDGAGVDLLRQLLIADDEAEALLAALPREGRPIALVEMLLSDAWLPTILARGQAFAGRLFTYLRGMIDPRPGDTLMLIDLGYNGTVQNRIDGALARTFGCHVAGRYLLLCEDAQTGLDKAGMIDRTRHDDDTLAALMSAISVLEQFCTVSNGSVIEYRADGTPIRAVAGIKGRQSEVRDRAQAGCIAFAKTGDAAMVRADPAGREAAERAAAIATLARFLFLPLPRELDLMTRFEHDANLGSDDRVALFDAEAGARGLREGGLFYLKGARRMYLPAELRGQGLPTSLALLTQRRFGLDLRYADFCDSEIALDLLVADGRKVFVDTVRATPTHDGYHVAAIPIGACRYSIGVQFGRRYEWLQIESARFLPVAAFLTGEARVDAAAIPAIPSCEGIEQVAPHLFHCADADGFLMVPPPAGGDPATPMMLAIVFRPLVQRVAVAVTGPPPAATESAPLSILTGASL